MKSVRRHQLRWLAPTAFLGALGGTPLVAAAQDADPFGEVSPAVAGAVEAAACSQVSETACSAANTSFLLMSVAYVALGLALFVTFHMWWKGRGAQRQGAKLAIPLVLGALVVGSLVAFDPFATETFTCCTADPTYRAVILLGDSPPARGAALGAVPFAVLYMVLVIGLTALRNRRGR